MQESVYKQRVEPRRLPENAPNILIVLIDDAGPGLPTTFGGEVNTPTMDRIVGGGIAYNRFHTTAMCSPTRASLLTGRNHHRVACGQIAELARRPNVVCKISGVITEADHAAWTADQVKPYVAHVVEQFGFDRVMFGSDWTVSELTHLYPRWVEIVDEIVAGASESELRALYRDTAIRTYRLPT